MNNLPSTVANIRLETILEHVADGITVQDKQGKLTYVNPAAAKLMGFTSAHEVLEASPQAIMQQFEIFDENLQPLPWTQLPGRQAMSGQQEPARVVGFKSKGSDTISWSSVKASPVCDASGDIEYVVNVFQDITQIKNTEIRLKDANQRITRLLENILKADE